MLTSTVAWAMVGGLRACGCVCLGVLHMVGRACGRCVARAVVVGGDVCGAGGFFDPCVIFVAIIPCGPAYARCLDRHAREEQHREHCCAWPCGHAALSVCVRCVDSQFARFCCAGAQLSCSQSVVTVRSSRRGPSDPQPVAFRAGSASGGGVRREVRAVPGGLACRAGSHITCLARLQL